MFNSRLRQPSRSPRVVLVAGAVALATTLAACGGGSDAASGSSGGDCTLKIGVLEPLSGPAASLGEPVVATAKLAAEELNRTKEAGGCTVELSIQDYKSDPGTAVTRVRRLLGDKVYGIIGPNQGSVTLAIAPILKTGKVPICALNNTISITAPAAGNDNIFRCHTNDKDNTRAAILFLKKKYQAKKIAIIHTDDAYGTEASNALVEAAKSGDTQITVTDNITYPYAATDATSEWARAKAGNPDAYVLWGSGTSQPVALRAAAQLGNDKPIIGGQGLTTEAVIKASGAAAEGIYAISLFNPSEVTESQKAAVAALRKAHGADYQPTTFDYIGWDSIHLIAKAYAAKPKDAKAGMESLKDVALAGGTYSFGADRHDGLGLDSIWVTQVEKGKFVGIESNLAGN
jgi:branched-chain amino acid transport system substrate-binding protein